MSDATVAPRPLEAQLQPLLLRDRPDDVAHRLEHLGNRERLRLAADQAIAATHQLDDVARDGVQAEGRGIDQAELPLLQRRQRAAPAAQHDLGEEEDRSERRAEIVGDLDHEVEPARPGHPLLESLGPARLHGGRDLFQRAQDGTQPARRHGGIVLDQVAAQQGDNAPIERGGGFGHAGVSVGCLDNLRDHPGHRRGHFPLRDRIHREPAPLLHQCLGGLVEPPPGVG